MCIRLAYRALRQRLALSSRARPIPYALLDPYPLSPKMAGCRQLARRIQTMMVQLSSTVSPHTALCMLLRVRGLSCVCSYAGADYVPLVSATLSATGTGGQQLLDAATRGRERGGGPGRGGGANGHPWPVQRRQRLTWDIVLRRTRDLVLRPTRDGYKCAAWPGTSTVPGGKRQALEKGGGSAAM